MQIIVPLVIDKTYPEVFYENVSAIFSFHFFFFLFILQSVTDRGIMSGYYDWLLIPIISIPGVHVDVIIERLKKESNIPLGKKYCVYIFYYPYIFLNLIY